MLADIDEILDVRLGTQSVQRIYLGEELVYEKQPEYDDSMLVGTYPQQVWLGNYLYNTDYNFDALVIEYIDDEGDLVEESLKGRDGTRKEDGFIHFDVARCIGVDLDKIQHIEIGGYFTTVEHLPKIKATKSSWNVPFGFNVSLESLNLKGLKVSYAGIKWMSGAFGNIRKINYINLSPLDLSKAENVSVMFHYNEKLKKINMGSNDFSNATYTHEMFFNCTSLATIKGTLRFQTSVSFSQSPLDDATAEMLLRNVQQVSTTQTIEFSPTTYDRISNELKALATSKGWSVVRG